MNAVISAAAGLTANAGESIIQAMEITARDAAYLYYRLDRHLGRA